MRTKAAVLAALLVVAGLATAPVTLARFGAGGTVAASMATATLAAPTGLAGTGGLTASLTWTPSTSTTATGYELWRSATTGSGYTQVGTVTPVSASSTTDAATAGTWYYVMRTYAGGWTSAYSNEASVLVSGVTTTGVKRCTSNAAETSNAGDNNGFESSPGNACLQDGLYASDNNTGTSSASNSCTANSKDKHRFWGYSFGLPTTISSISGVTVTAIADQSNNGGTTWMCVQLSWDGGGTWSTAKSVVMTSNTAATYTFGGTADTWGRTWVRENLTTTNFRVRVINSSTQPSKTIRLDWLGVEVAYQP